MAKKPTAPGSRSKAALSGAKPAVPRRAQHAAPLDAVFDGACSLEIPDVDDPPPLEDYPLCADIVFSAARDKITVTGFEPIATSEYSASLGPMRVKNRTTVLLKSSTPGRLTRDGHATIPLVLRFDHLFDAPLYEEDSDLALTLSTAAPGGSPMDEEGRATLVGEGTFSGGALHGKRCRLTYRGRAMPMPW